jgi:coronin-1B/1C/6
MAGRFVRSSKYRVSPCLSAEGKLLIYAQDTSLVVLQGRYGVKLACNSIVANHKFQEQCYDNLRISRNAWDTNLVKVSPRTR